MIKRLFALLCVLVLLPLCAIAQEEPTLDDRVVSAFRRFSTIGGMVVAAKDGKIVYSYTYGYANRSQRILATEDSYWRLASVSKLVTATAVMRLVETGELNLDDNLGNIIGGDSPYFAANPKFPTVGITPRMLMSHTSTIWDSYFSTRSPLRDVLDVTKKVYSSFYKEEPGTVYHYSNYAAGILGCVLEAVTGLRLSDAVSKLIFDRMDIDAAYTPELLDYPENVTSSFSRDYSPEINIDHDYFHSYGGCWMKGQDLCRIGMMLCDYGVIDGQRILEESTVKEMLDSQQGKGGISVDSPYGLNVMRFKNLVPGKIIYGHQGRSDNVLCHILFDPETRFTFAMVTNWCEPGEPTGGVRSPGYTLFKLMWTEFVGEWPKQ